MDYSLIISIISVAFAIFSGALAMRRTDKKDVAQDASQLTTVIVKLENIGNTINEIKNDIKSVRKDINDHSERITKLEEKVKVLNKEVFENGKTDKEIG